jgi:hypothetical protein
MANDIELKKMRIIEAYSGSEKWTGRVNKMSDAQVLAVYARLVREGRIK